MAYIKDPEGNIVWFGTAISELNHWKEQLRQANTKIQTLENEIIDKNQKMVRYAEFETPEWKAMVIESERVYASRTGNSLPKDIKKRLSHG